jgi:hypothetical protein
VTSLRAISKLSRSTILRLSSVAPMWCAAPPPRQCRYSTATGWRTARW